MSEALTSYHAQPEHFQPTRYTNGFTVWDGKYTGSFFNLMDDEEEDYIGKEKFEHSNYLGASGTQYIRFPDVADGGAEEVAEYERRIAKARREKADRPHLPKNGRDGGPTTGRAPRRRIRRRPAPAPAATRRPPQPRQRRPRLRALTGGTGLGSGVGPLVTAPAALSRQMTTNAPRIVGTARSFRVRHRELVDDTIPGSTTFVIQNTIQLNPGLSATFPWLAPQARQYEQYVVHLLRFLYMPIAPTSTQGSITLMPEYDPTDPAPATEYEASDQRGTVENNCWSPVALNCDVAAMMGSSKRKFVRGSAVAADLKNYDLGQVFVITNNMTGATAVGKLWVEYDFEFFEPQATTSALILPRTCSNLYWNSAQTFASGVQTTMNGTCISAGFGEDPLGLAAIYSSASGFWIMPAGAYKISYNGMFRNTVAESTQIVVRLMKSGVLLNGAISELLHNPGVTNNSNPMEAIGLFYFNGTTDTFSIDVTMVGATGTLTRVANYSNIVFELCN
jgi:hypothetical protein